MAVGKPQPVVWRRKTSPQAETKIGRAWSATKTADPAPGRLHMWAADTEPSERPELVCLLGETAPQLVRGMGGWEQIEKGGRRAGSYWPGSETPAFEITVYLENRAVPTGADGVVEKMRVLERLCGPTLHGGNRPPPPVQWSANHPLHDHARRPHLEWVCESLTYGDAMYDDRAVLLAQPAVIVLAVFEDAEVERLKRANPFPRKELRKGETLRQFAKRVLGDAKRWEDVADLNRDTKGCPRTPGAKAKRAVMIAVPPRETRGKDGKRRSDDAAKPPRGYTTKVG